MEEFVMMMVVAVVVTLFQEAAVHFHQPHPPHTPYTGGKGIGAFRLIKI